MTRTEAIAHINARLATLDDERVQAVADLVEDMAANDAELRPLTARELELIEQSREDFRTGRTLTIEEVRARSDKFIAALRDKYPDAP